MASSAAPDAQLQYAVMLHQRGDLGRAQAMYEEILRAFPRHFDALHMLGVLAAGMRNPAKAAELIGKAIAIDPRVAAAHHNRGLALQELQQWSAALASYDCAIALDPAAAGTHFARANVLSKLARWDAALAGFDRAIELAPDHVDALSNRAFVLNELERLDAALGSCDRAIAIKPDHADAHANRGGVLVAMRRLDAAIASFTEAIAAKPDFTAAYVLRGMARLTAGDFEQGWRDLEWREKIELPQPPWLGGESLAGKTICLYSEQGLGDTIQFCRYASLVAEMGARVVLLVPQTLARLLGTVAGVAQVAVPGAPLPPFDTHCSLLSLPLALCTTLATIPARIPYLSTDADRSRHWQEKLGRRERIRVGLVWSSGFRPESPAYSRRNIPLSMLRTLRHPAIEFFSLQKGQPAESELAALAAKNWDGPEIEDFTGELHDFAETAALMEQLDLIISVDTSTAHLAGALGKPVWLLTRFDSCWRWLLDRSDSPWYPTMRLYRQEALGDWEGVVRRLRGDLERLTADL